MWYGFRPYVSAAQKRARAERELQKQRKQGQASSPVVIEGRTIAHTFWGKAWCDNLEAYSDYENRLPRGRTYVRNGSVVDLRIQPGKIEAQVSGSSLYKITIDIAPLPHDHWRSIKSRCAGQIGSLVELLQGRLSKSVMDIVTAHEGGLFPKPREIKLKCSCPDWAGLCKHLAAVLYGVGARLDHQPELLFVLRKVDHLELIEEAVPRAGNRSSTGKKTLVESDVADVFGIEFVENATPAVVNQTQATNRRVPRRSKNSTAKARKSTPPAEVEALGTGKVRGRATLARKKGKPGSKRRSGPVHEQRSQEKPDALEQNHGDSDRCT